jgi:hypothetical protein
MKKVFATICFLLVAGVLSAQQLSPVITEAKYAKGNNRFHGYVDLTNPGIQPIVTSLEVKSFIMSDKGVITITPLPAGLHVSLSQTSLKIGANQKMTVEVEAECPGCAKEPYYFMVWATTYVGRTSGPLAVNVGQRLDAAFYVCPAHEKTCRQQVRQGIFHVVDAAQSTVLAENK